MNGVKSIKSIEEKKNMHCFNGAQVHINIQNYYKLIFLLFIFKRRPSSVNSHPCSFFLAAVLYGTLTFINKSKFKIVINGCLTFMTFFLIACTYIVMANFFPLFLWSFFFVSSRFYRMYLSQNNHNTLP